MADEFDLQEHSTLHDGHTLWRLSLWGGTATVAVAATVLILNADIGLDRIVQALSQPSPDKQVVAQDELYKRVEAQRAEETRRFEERLRELAADRDKLNSRLATLEQNFGDLTGSIKRDIAAVAATALAGKQEAPAPAANPSVTPAPVLAAPSVTAAPAAVPQAPVRAETPPVQAPQIVTVPLPTPPPPRIAAAAPDEPRKPELGIDLGGARSLEVLQARWIAVKANFGPLIEGLRPLAGYDDRPGIIPHRLIVGPLPNGAAAAQLCSRFAASKVPCRPTDYDGEKLVQ